MPLFRTTLPLSENEHPQDRISDIGGTVMPRQDQSIIIGRMTAYLDSAMKNLKTDVATGSYYVDLRLCAHLEGYRTALEDILEAWNTFTKEV